MIQTINACRLAAILFLAVGAASLSAQNAAVRGSIQLNIQNAEKQPLEGVSIGLMRLQDSTLAKIAITDQAGATLIEEIKPGAYFLTAYLIGHEKYSSPYLLIDDAHKQLELPAIQLERAAQALSEVTVARKKPFLERQLDKLVINVESSIASTGSSVLEVLERAPGVMINQETSINLKGRAGVIVMIDGKISPLSGAELIQYLKGIPAANIDKIEIITNPSARYDAAGNAGIINIRFKKDQRQGFNGSLSLSAGQGFYFKPSGSTNLNFRKKKWNLFGNYSYGQPKGFGRFFINRKFFDNQHAVESVFDQNSFTQLIFKNHTGKIGADFYAGKRTVIGAMLSGTATGGQRDGYTFATISDAEKALQYTTETAGALKEKRWNGFGNLNFKHTIDSTGKELTMDIDYGRFDSKAKQHIVTEQFAYAATPPPGFILNTDQQGIINVKSLKADYVNPLKKEAKLEAGIKSSLVETDNDIQFFNEINGVNELDNSRSNHFIYKENINAAYLNYAKSFARMDVQAGLRMEQTITRGNQISSGEQFERKYAYLFPSIFVNRKLSENHLLSFSYSRRIDRPDYRQLNPFRIFVDSYTYVVGDPGLKPVLSNSFELSHTLNQKYSLTLSYVQSKEVITDVFVQDDSTKISYQIPANLQNFEQVSLGVSIPFSVRKWLNSSITGSIYYNRYTSPFQSGQLLNASTSWDLNVNNSFSLGKGWSAELSGMYQSRMAWGLFIIRDLAQINAGLQKTSADKLSTFKLAISDIFYTNHIAVIVQYQNQDWYTDRTWDSKVVTLSYVQRFGKNTVQQARRRATGIEDEKKRAG